MRRAALALAAASALLALLALLPAAAGAEFGFKPGSVRTDFSAADGSPGMQAGSHPDTFATSLEPNARVLESGGHAGELVPDGEFKDLRTELPPGLVGTNSPVPPCSTAAFLLSDTEHPNGLCEDSSAIGVAEVAVSNGPAPLGPEEEVLANPAAIQTVPVYLLPAPPGAAAKLGFVVVRVPVTVEVGLNPTPPYNIQARGTDISQALLFFGIRLKLWGAPADPSHDAERGNCAGSGATDCPASVAPAAFLTMPRSCAGPLSTRLEADSWQRPGQWVTAFATTDDGAEPPSPLGVFGCGALGFEASISSRPTSAAAQSASGLHFDLEVTNPGLTDPEGVSGADIAKTVVTLPEGMSVNPSQAEGLEVCSEADLARESADSPFGAGCPAASKVGTIEVQTPLLEGETLTGSLFVAEPYHNLAEDSLIAVYVVIRDPERGIVVKQPIEVEPDPQSGRLVATASDMPQLPFSDFRLRFREGARAPLITPPGCGTFETRAELYPSSGGPPLTSTSAFQIVSGPDNSPCPSGAAPFEPGFEAGTLNNAAGRYSPFVMRITRGDAEQDISRFSSVLPPGVVGRIAGIPWCPEAGIAQARSRSGPHGGAAEQSDPSCPAASQIGRTIAGAGVGSQLTYVPGRLYLAGPYHGAPLSVVSITPALAGPFDAGAVVVREALTLNPITAEVAVDGAASDPIPHILQGIPLSLRDLRVYADRPGFTLNATGCEPSLARATVWGAGTVVSPTGETPVGLAARYQAAGCAALGFKPKLGVKLKGGTRRGAHPALRAVLTPRPGDANLSRAVVTLPHSAFLEQAHIRTVCTRVAYAAGPGHGALCPQGSIYGHARAWTPLLAQPLAGPVYLRSSNHKLPDLILSLHGTFDVELGARIDSRKGGIRTSFAGLPDAPVSRFVLEMQGGKKGLIVNSQNLCSKPKRNRARAGLGAQSGRRRTLRPVVRALGCKKKHRKRRGGKRSRR